MTTFYLIRHGTNDYVGKTIAGWLPGVHLNQKGRQEADALALHLASAGIQTIYSSPLERALETGTPLAQQFGLEIQIAREIGEIEFGDWTGQTLAQLDANPEWRKWNAFRSGTRIPKGESMIDVQCRMVSFIERLRRESPNRLIAIVSHGDPIRALVTYHLGIPLDLLHRIEISPASVSILEISDSSSRMLCVNHYPQLCS